MLINDNISLALCSLKAVGIMATSMDRSNILLPVSGFSGYGKWVNDECIWTWANSSTSSYLMILITFQYISSAILFSLDCVHKTYSQVPFLEK